MEVSELASITQEKKKHRSLESGKKKSLSYSGHCATADDDDDDEDNDDYDSGDDAIDMNWSEAENSK